MRLSLLKDVEDSKEFYINEILPQKILLHKKYVLEKSYLKDLHIILITIKYAWFHTFLGEMKRTHWKLRQKISHISKQLFCFFSIFQWEIIEVELELEFFLPIFFS